MKPTSTGFPLVEPSSTPVVLTFALLTEPSSTSVTKVCTCRADSNAKRTRYFPRVGLYRCVHRADLDVRRRLPRAELNRNFLDFGTVV